MKERIYTELELIENPNIFEDIKKIFSGNEDYFYSGLLGLGLFGGWKNGVSVEKDLKSNSIILKQLT